MAKVFIDVSKVNLLVERLAAMQVRLSDLTVPLMEGAKRGKEDTLRDFDSGGAFSGAAWAQLSAETLKRDKYPDAQNRTGARPASNHRPLILSGRFRSSVRAGATKFRGWVELGPAYWLNYIGTRGGQKNPPREAGYISQQTVDFTINLILEHALEQKAKAA